MRLQFELWETVYYHNMPSHAALVEWAKGTRLRPYLSALKEAEAEAFEQEILHRVSEAYPVMENGEVILPFRRFFFVAHK